MLVAICSGDEPPSVSRLRLRGERYLQAVKKMGLLVDWIHIGSKLALHRLNRTNCDVVHIHNVHGSWMSLKALSALCHRVPTVWTLHDEWALTGGLCYDLSHVGGKYGQEIRRMPGTDMCFPDSTAAQRFKRHLRDLLPQPSLVVCPSAYMEGLMHQSGKFPGVPCARVPYGLGFKDLPATALPRREARELMGFQPDDRVVLLLAAHLNSCFKGQSLAIDALKSLPADEFKVLVIGRGGEKIAGSIPQQVVAKGFLNDDKMIAAAYRAADVTLVPSVADNFPYVALESMACATPLVAFRIGGLTEMVGPNERGLLATPFEVSEFAGNIKSLLDSAEVRERMGNAGRRWVAENCGMAQWSERHRQLYQTAIEAFSARNSSMSMRSPAPTTKVVQ